MRTSTLSGSVILGILLTASFARAAAPATTQAAPGPKTPADFYKTEKVWTIHLRFTPEQWAAIEPRWGGAPGPFNRVGGGGGNGPASYVAPAFIKAGDTDNDYKFTKDEFHALGARWFKLWDKGRRGQVTLEELRAGLEVTIGAPGGVGMGGSRVQGYEGKRNGVASVAGIEFAYVHADLDVDGTTVKDVGVRYKGNGTYMQSRGQLKRSFKVDVNQYVKGQTFAGVTTLNLHANVTDPGYMNEVLSHRLYRDAGSPAPRTTYARVYVTVPGEFERQYFGLYSVIENPDKRFAAEMTGAKGGAIFKPCTPMLFEDFGDDWARYKQVYDAKTDLTQRQVRRVLDFAKLMSNADDATFAAKVGEYLDLEQFARYIAVTTWLATFDSILGMGQNFYVYLNPETERFQFFPWDLDGSFGQFQMIGTQQQREQLSIEHPWRGENRFLERVFKVDAFKRVYLKTFADLNRDVFRPQRLYEQVEELGAALRPAVEEEGDDKLMMFDRLVARGQLPAEPGQPLAPRVPGSPAVRRPVAVSSRSIKGFAAVRARSVAAQLSGQSTGLEVEGTGPSSYLARGFMTALDADRDGQLTKAEALAGFDKWFASWNADDGGQMSGDELWIGINSVFNAPRNGGRVIEELERGDRVREVRPYRP